MLKDSGENTQTGWMITFKKLGVPGKNMEDKVSNVR
jgi:hypothetical protein